MTHPQVLSDEQIDKVMSTPTPEGGDITEVLRMQGRAIESATLEALANQKPVASIYITALGDREFDDWKCELPVGRNELYTHPSPTQPPAQAEREWLPIETAPEDIDQCVAVRWKDSEGNECRDLDYMEDGCWMHWHDRAEHVEMIGGHGVSYTPPYEHWMPLPPPPAALKGQQ